MPTARMAQMIFFIGAPVGADLRALRSRRLISPGRTEKNHFHLIIKRARKLARVLVFYRFGEQSCDAWPRRIIAPPR